MNLKNFFFVLLFAVTPILWAQDQQQNPRPFGGNQATAGLPERIIQMHKQEIEAMKADIEKMKSSLGQMKTNVAAIKDSAEKARWQTSVDMWETVINHMDRTERQMEAMTPDTTGRMPQVSIPSFPPPIPPPGGQLQ